MRLIYCTLIGGLVVASGFAYPQNVTRESQIPAFGTVTYDVLVEGTELVFELIGDRDVELLVHDASGRLIERDEDRSDNTIAVFRLPPGNRRTVRVSVRNLSSLFNQTRLSVVRGGSIVGAGSTVIRQPNLPQSEQVPLPAPSQGATPTTPVPTTPVPTTPVSRTPVPTTPVPTPPVPNAGQVVTPPTPPAFRDVFDEVDTALAQLVRGNIAFNAPERMGFRETRTIALLASTKLEVASLSQELRNRLTGADPIEVETLQIAPLMEAELKGEPAFQVTPLTPIRQPVSGAAPTEWRWTVRANEAGKQTLHLTINAVVTVDGERFPRSLNVLDREIDVEITAMQLAGMFIERNWQWLAGTVLIPLAMWLWANRVVAKRQRRK